MPRSSTGRAASWGSSPSATSWITPLTPSPEGLPATTVKDIMTPVAVTIGEETPLNEVALCMAQHGIHRVVVVNHAQQVRGIVTSMDIVWWVAAQA